MPGDGREHLALPKWLLVIRFAQIVFAVIALGLAAYYTSKLNVDNLNIVGAHGGIPIFTAIATFIIVGYIIASTTAVKAIYNYWAHLALDIFLIIFWITSLGLAADLASLLGKTYFLGYYEYAFDSSLKGSAGGAAGMSAIEFVLFVICAVLEGLAITKTGKGTSGAVAGGPQAYGTAAPNGGAQPYATGPPAGHEMTSPTQGQPQPIPYGNQAQPQQYVAQQAYSPPPQDGSYQSYPTPPPAQQGYAPPTQPYSAELPNQSNTGPQPYGGV